MSHSIDETYTFYRETLRCAAKPHECDACHGPIAKGHRYYDICAGSPGGDKPDSLKRCVVCQEMHLHLRALAPGELWPDERLNCGETYQGEWGCDPPDDVARLAFLTPDEAQRELL